MPTEAVGSDNDALAPLTDLPVPPTRGGWRGRSRRVPGRRRLGWWPDLLIPAIASIVVIALCWLVVDRSRSTSREGLSDSFAANTESAANSLASYIDNLHRLAGVQAEDLLSGAEVTHDDDEQFRSVLGFVSSGVFDERGVLLANAPYVPELLGQEFRSRLEHVRLALDDGTPQVSQVFVSPAIDIAVVAVAVPFDTPFGRRVVTGLFAVEEGVLASIAEQTVGLVTDEVILVDRDHNIIAMEPGPAPSEVLALSKREPELETADAEEEAGTYRDATGLRFHASGPIADTGWRLITHVAVSKLYDPVQTSERSNQIVFSVVIALCLSGMALVGAATHQRRRAEQELLELNSQLEQRVTARTDELSRANERMSDANTRLAAANNELESFSYSVSHDLRAPLRAINGFAQALEDDHRPQLDEDGVRLLDRVRANTAKMSQLIDDLLDFSRVGRRELEHQTVPMDALVREVLAEIEELERDRQLDVTIDPLGEAIGDRALLRQVWANLISNAVKFTADNDHAAIHVYAEPTDDEVVYRVQDNGVGFDMAYVDKLFGVFQRLHGAEFPGTGIGLAIAQRIVARHGGRIWAESEPGRGARFSFALPRAPDQKLGVSHHG